MDWEFGKGAEGQRAVRNVKHSAQCANVKVLDGLQKIAVADL